jgi:hypothetical protein
VRSSSSLSADVTGAPALEFLTVNEMGAGGDMLGADPLITPIPSPLQSVPREPASTHGKAPVKCVASAFFSLCCCVTAHLHWR